MSKIFKDIVGFENYKIDNNGTVINKITGKIKKPTKHMGGYLTIDLYNNGVRQKKYVHRLVAEAFVPKISGKTHVNHIDEDKTNNNVNNLEWCTQRENNNYGTANKRMALTKSKTTVSINLKSGFINIESSVKSFVKYGFTYSGITQVCRGVFNKHKNHKFFYVVGD